MNLNTKRYFTVAGLLQNKDYDELSVYEVLEQQVQIFAGPKPQFLPFV